ncbi:hypothetical protein [Sporosarcina phage Lietuvens]|nr:hypothetical protein [Sporosarcina phage Lietuvens]
MSSGFLKYRPSIHAIERLRDYFGTSELHAMDYANDLMKGAQLVETQKTGRRVFKSAVQDVMLVVGDDNTIITVLPPPGRGKNNAYGAVTAAIEATSELSMIIIRTVKREYAKACTNYKRQHRKYALLIADLNIEVAELERNKLRCKHPDTQTIIQRNIDATLAEVDALQAQLDEMTAEHERLAAEAKTYLGDAVVTA